MSEDKQGQAASLAKGTSREKRDSRRDYRREWREKNREKLRLQRRAKYIAKRAALGLPYAPKSQQVAGPCSYCGNPKHYAKGLCNNCWRRNLKHGSPDYRIPPHETAEEKVARLHCVDEVTGCWLWKGIVNRNGTPHAVKDSRGYNPRRVAYESLYRPLPKRVMFRQPLCGNPLCISPDHQDIHVLVSEQDKATVLSTIGMPVTVAEKREVAAKLRAAKFSLQEIGDALGVTRQRAEQLLRASSMPSKREKMEQEWGVISRMLAEGKSRCEIAEAVGLKLPTLHNRILRRTDVHGSAA